MTITPVRIGDKIELYGEIYGKEIGDMNLSACRLTFREITPLLYWLQFRFGFPIRPSQKSK